MIKPIQVDITGEHNPNTELSKEDVLRIRTLVHIEHKDCIDVYQEYKDKISYSAFRKIIHGVTWTNVDTSMIKPVHVERIGKPKAKLSKDDVIYIRYQYDNHLKTLSDLYTEFPFVTPVTIRRVVNRETWKNI